MPDAVITPHFAITSSPEQMEMTRTLVAAHSYRNVQTHLSEIGTQTRQA
jgi:guanine deaminase